MSKKTRNKRYKDILERIFIKSIEYAKVDLTKCDSFSWRLDSTTQVYYLQWRDENNARWVAPGTKSKKEFGWLKTIAEKFLNTYRKKATDEHNS